MRKELFNAIKTKLASDVPEKQGDRFLFQLATVKSAKGLLCMCD